MLAPERLFGPLLELAKEENRGMLVERAIAVRTLQQRRQHA